MQTLVPLTNNGETYELKTLPGTLSPDAAAAQLGITRSQVLRCLHQRKLAGIKVLTRWLVYEHDLERFRAEFAPLAGKSNIRRRSNGK